MTDNTTEQKLDRTSLLAAKIEAAKQDLADAQAKLDRLVAEQRNADRLLAIAVGDTVSFEYGRAPNRRVLTGTVQATGDDAKMGRMLAVATGEGLDVQVVKIRAADVIIEGAADASE